MRALLLLAALFFAPAAHAQTLEDLHWLKGCWRTEGGETQITEVWIAPPGPAMFGYSYTVRDGEVRSWEQMRIAMMGGWLHFVAMPNGGPPVRFRMREGDTPNAVQFDNPEHDYPQTVAYRRAGNALVATISGANGADLFTFNYRRISCARNLRP